MSCENCERLTAERDKAWADLVTINTAKVAAEARVTEYERGIVWDTTCLNCAKVIENSHKEYEQADAARAELAAANTRIAELEELAETGFKRAEFAEATNAALSARLERVRALADECAEAIEPDGSQSIAPVHWFADMLRAALGEDA